MSISPTLNPIHPVEESAEPQPLPLLRFDPWLALRARRLGEKRTTARIMLLALGPALIVIPQPDLGTGLVYLAIGFAILFVAGTSWKQLSALAAVFVASIAIILAGAPALGVHVLKP